MGRWPSTPLPGSAATSSTGWRSRTRAGPYPDGTPFLGISFRQYDEGRETWIIEFLNVSESFLRRQVHHGTGSVTVSGGTVTVTSESPGIVVREHYVVADADNWVYRLDSSDDGGRSWNEGAIEFTFRRS